MNNAVKNKIKSVIKKNKLLFQLYRIYTGMKERKVIKKRSITFNKYGEKIFSEFLNLCNEDNLKCWLCYGTLLGFIRENHILKFDCDFDVGIWYSDYSKKFEKKLIENGFSLEHEFNPISNYKAFEQTYKKAGVSIDVFYHYCDESSIWTHVFYREQIDDLPENLFRIRKLDYPKAELKKINFLKNEVYIPSNAEEYLQEIYGVNWRIPDPNYDWRKGPKNNCTVKNEYAKYSE